MYLFGYLYLLTSFLIMQTPSRPKKTAMFRSPAPPARTPWAMIRNVLVAHLGSARCVGEGWMFNKTRWLFVCLMINMDV